MLLHLHSGIELESSESMGTLEDLLLSMLPMAFLSVIIIIGYYLAWTDFKPKSVKSNEEFQIRYEPVSDSFPKTRELTDRELGLQSPGTKSGLPPELQRRLRMEERIRQYSQESPSGAASVIKSWLSEY